MTAKFTEALNRVLNKTTTTNGMLAYRSTLNALLDLFRDMGNYRGEYMFSPEYFDKAYEENPEMAARLLMFNRDIRGGQGVKRLAQYVYSNIDNYPELRDYLVENMWVVPDFGYWKDLYHFEGTSIENDMIAYWCNQIKLDLSVIYSSQALSLAAKWCPTESSKASDKVKQRAKKFQKVLGWTPKQYRKNIGRLREELDIVERRMSAKQWKEIDYSDVPSIAMNNYKDAFMRHDEDGFMNWVVDPNTKVNTTGLTPVDVYKKLSYPFKYDPFIDKQWKYLQNIESDWNIFPVIDCSGSMLSDVGNVSGLTISNALGVYFAQRLKGPYKNLLMQFSHIAQYVQLTGELFEDAKIVNRLNEFANTNLQAVFEKILETATEYNLSADELPSHLLLVSDMQFDVMTRNTLYSSQSGDGYDAIDMMREQFKNAGYNIPHIIFWNVNAGLTAPVEADRKGVTLLSGWSPKIIDYLFTGEYNQTQQQIVTPEEQMMTVLNNERYEVIRFA